MPSRLNPLIQRLQSLIADNPDRAPVGASIGIAVSGGLDSIALADLLIRLAPEFKWTLTLLHYNHRLRGVESDRDQAFVCDFGKKSGIPVEVEAATPNGEPAASDADLIHNQYESDKSHVQGSMEMKARALRHDFLARKAVDLNLDFVALAHHQDDQQELFWIRLLRGSSIEGLGGMHFVSPSPSNPKVKLWRPMLDFPRLELLDYIQWRDLQFREDKSNQELDPLRNRVRLEMIPWIQEKMQPGIRAVVNRWVNHAREIHQDLERWRAQLLVEGCYFQLWPRTVQKLHVAKQLPEIGRKPEEKIITWLIDNPRKWMSLDPDRRVRLETGGNLESEIIIRKENRNDRAFEQIHFSPGTGINEASHLELDLTGSGSLQMGTTELKWEIENLNGSEILWTNKNINEEWFDADKVGSRCRLRWLKPGDTFFPIGASGPLKLKKYLSGLGCGSKERKETLIAETEQGKIFWCSRGRIGELFKLDKTASRRLKWTFMRR